MTRPPIVLAGRTWITLESLADCYGVSRAFAVEVYRFGLLGEGVAVDDTVAVAATMLDRMAEACRLHRLLGVEASALALLLDGPDGIWEAARPPGRPAAEPPG